MSYTHCQWKGVLLKNILKKEVFGQAFQINRSEPNPSRLHIVTWVGVGSKQLKTVENNSFLLFLPTLY